MTTPTIDKYSQRDLIPPHLARAWLRSGGFDCASGLYMFARTATREELKRENKLCGDYLVLANEDDMKDGAKGLTWMIGHGYTRVES